MVSAAKSDFLRLAFKNPIRWNHCVHVLFAAVCSANCKTLRKCNICVLAELKQAIQHVD